MIKSVKKFFGMLTEKEEVTSKDEIKSPIKEEIQQDSKERCRSEFSNDEAKKDNRKAKTQRKPKAEKKQN